MYWGLRKPGKNSAFEQALSIQDQIINAITQAKFTRCNFRPGVLVEQVFPPASGSYGDDTINAGVQAWNVCKAILYQPIDLHVRKMGMDVGNNG